MNFESGMVRGGVRAMSAAMALFTYMGVSNATAGESFLQALDESTPIVDVRLRYERVDQDGQANIANGVTARARLGFETGKFYDFSFLVEGEVVTGIVDNFNASGATRAGFPTIADGDTLEINRLQVKYTGIEDVTLTAGRQRIVLDNARFIGDVGWRQNQQTYDAGLAEITAIDDLTFTYGYIDSVRRIFGSKTAPPFRSFDSDSHIINAKYSGLPWVTVTGYAYLIELEEAAALSTATFGGTVSGSYPITDDIPLNLSAAFANQSDYGNNTRSIDNNYYSLAAGTKVGGFTASANLEVLEGDGTTGFSTPLATLHKFQGYADVFLTTPAGGIEDLYGEIGYVFTDVGPLPKVVTKAIYHDFESEQTGASLGDEIDLVVKAVINSKLSATLKFASFDGTSAGPADIERLFFQFDFKL